MRCLGSGVRLSVRGLSLSLSRGLRRSVCAGEPTWIPSRVRWKSRSYTNRMLETYRSSRGENETHVSSRNPTVHKRRAPVQNETRASFPRRGLKERKKHLAYARPLTHPAGKGSRRRVLKGDFVLGAYTNKAPCVGKGGQIHSTSSSAASRVAFCRLEGQKRNSNFLVATAGPARSRERVRRVRRAAYVARRVSLGSRTWRGSRWQHVLDEGGGRFAHDLVVENLVRERLADGLGGRAHRVLRTRLTGIELRFRYVLVTTTRFQYTRFGYDGQFQRTKSARLRRLSRTRPIVYTRAASTTRLRHNSQTPHVEFSIVYCELDADKSPAAWSWS